MNASPSAGPHSHGYWLVISTRRRADATLGFFVEESGALPAHPSPQHRLEDPRFGIEMDDPFDEFQARSPR